MTLQDKMFEAIKANNTHVNPDSDIEESAKSCAEIANQEKIAYAVETICEKVTRIEVIDNNGRAYVNWDKNNKVELRLQDDGKTLKIFISNPSHH